jgi:hypothetical protein
VFGLVRAAVDRAGAKGYHRLTGKDPNACAASRMDPAVEGNRTA